MRYFRIAVLLLTFLPVFSAFCEETGNNNEKTGELYVVSTSHLDTQWRWTIQKTIDELILNTLVENIDLIERYPNYVFSWEGAFRYQLAKEYYPEQYQKMKELIADDRWKVAGSWLDAVDVNVPSPESLFRNALYGNGYFKREFGKKSVDIFLPDCFGFGYALPTIARHSGITGFTTQKLTWGCYVGIPFNIGKWRGVDGSEILATVNPGAYVSNLRSDISRDSLWITTAQEQGEKFGHPVAYKYIGVGDMGGGVDDETAEWLEKSIASDGQLKVLASSSDQIFKDLSEEETKDFEVYDGELIMKSHGVGCYTSQAAMKRWNRKNELLADAAERASVLGHILGGIEYPKKSFENAWTRFLWHQFHDDLTGTSIPEAYTFSWNDEILSLKEFAGNLEDAVGAVSRALDTRTNGKAIVVYNPLSIARNDVVEVELVYDGKAPEFIKVIAPDGNEVPSQIISREKKRLKALFLADVPSVGFSVYDIRSEKREKSTSSEITVDKSIMENGRYVVRIDRNGDIISIVDKKWDKELLFDSIKLQLLENSPKRWAAWEIDYDDLMAEPRAIVSEIDTIIVLENGPVRGTLEIVRRSGESIFTQRIQMTAGDSRDRIEVENDIEWGEKETLLKAEFPLSTENEMVTYDLGVGTIQRGLNTEALYEVPAQQWADITTEDGDYGVTIMNDSRYGWDHPDKNTLRLTLVHTPAVNENWSWLEDEVSMDLGHHSVTYAIEGHHVVLKSNDIVWSAARMNQPLLAFESPKHMGGLGNEFSLVEVGYNIETKNNPISIKAVKMAENCDDIVIRLQELTGQNQNDVKIKFNVPVNRIREINAVEEKVDDAEVVNNILTTSFTKYQPKSYAIEIGNLSVKLNTPLAQTLDLPYNEDGISSDENRLDGTFDEEGYSLSAELLGESTISKGIPFKFGPTDDGKLNVLSCEAQEITLHEGKFNRVYLLAASVDGDIDSEFKVDKKKISVTIPDYNQFIGQWDNRLTSGQFVHEPELIVPAYIKRTPVGWIGTHRHTPDGKNDPYEFTYLFEIKLDLENGAKTVTLPNDKRLKILAATMVFTENDQTKSIQPLFDVADNLFAEIDVEDFAFIDSISVKMDSPMGVDEIRYSVDGSEPDENSTLYENEFYLHEPTTLKARAFKKGFDDSHVSRVEFLKLDPQSSIEVEFPKSGLKLSYYEGEWDSLPDFGSLEAIKSSISSEIVIPEYARDEYYGLVFEGYILIPKDGAYTFELFSDDGSILVINGEKIIDNDGLHGSAGRENKIALKKGYHPITINMFQKGGGQDVNLMIKGPGIEKEDIKGSFLYHD